MITKVVELLLTAEIYNSNENLNEDDIPKDIRKILYNNGGIRRPLVIRESMIKEFNVSEKDLKRLPFIDLNKFNKQLKITSIELAAKWMAKNGLERIRKNPVLAYYFENYDSLNVSYEEAKRLNEPKYSDAK